MTDLDEQLAAATDELLSTGVMTPLAGENRELGEVISQLYRIIDPANRPSAECQEQLVSRLNRELDRQFAPPQLRLLDRPWVRTAALAAALVLVLAALIVLAVPETPEQLEGAAIGIDDGAALIVLLAVAAGGAAFYWRTRR